MRKTRLLPAFILLFTGLLVFIACRKYSEPSTPPDPTPTDQTVTASLQGRVLDDNGLPVKDAAVSSGNAATITDVNGVFNFANIKLSTRFGFVKVVKSGYFTGSRSIVTAAGSSNYLTINLLPRASKGTFPVTSGGTITVQGSNTVGFDPASVINAGTGAAYSGTVHVFAAYLDPKDVNLPKIMPGDLRGISAAGKETGLQTFGMMAVELEGDGGEKLQIASGKKATITMAIPASLQATAPASIPLWYFNDTTGKWIEQGSATKQGSNYVGQVSHFSYWNCDAPANLINFKVFLKDQHGNILAFTNVQFVSETLGTRGGFTDATGFAGGSIPKGQALTLQVTDPCGTVLYSQAIGPALADLDLGTLTVTTNPASLTLTGKVMDCSNKPVASGFVNASIDGLNYRAPVTNGAFSLSINRCSATPTQAKLVAADLGAQQIGNTSSVPVTSGSVDLGNLSACGVAFTQFVTVTLNGVTYSVTTPPDDSLFYYQSDTTGYVYANTLYNAANPKTINFAIYNPKGPGTYLMYPLSIAIGDLRYNAVNTLQCTITAYGAVNGFVEGNFSGTVQDNAKVPYPVTGSFKVLRSQ